MQWVLVLDGMAKRYGCLPSQILSTADSFDYYIFDVALSWNNYQQKKAHEKAGGKKEIKKVDRVTLEEMMKRVRENGNVGEND